MDKNNDRFEKENVYKVIGGFSDYVPDKIPDDNKKRTPWWVWAIIGTVVLATVIFLLVHFMSRPTTDKTTTVSSSSGKGDVSDIWHNNSDSKLPSCTIVSDSLIDSIHVQIFTPYNAVPMLHVGPFDTTDADIVFATFAADLGYDKGKIIGPFVYEGEVLSYSKGRKLGYCAIIDDNITLGVSENSSLFEESIETGGYFFRQYPAVNNGVMVENNPKNAAFRRALCCMLDGKICIVSTSNRVLMNDFAAILVKLGVDDAIFLVGGNAEGWYRTKDGILHQLGETYVKGNPNINYIVFRAQ